MRLPVWRYQCLRCRSDFTFRKKPWEAGLVEADEEAMSCNAMDSMRRDSGQLGVFARAQAICRFAWQT
jgi:hypothetical protein